jgi:hypothetical protein
MKESFLFSIINISTFLCAHTRKSLDFFPKVVNKQNTLNEEKITQVKNIEFFSWGTFDIITNYLSKQLQKIT